MLWLCCKVSNLKSLDREAKIPQCDKCNQVFTGNGETVGLADDTAEESTTVVKDSLQNKASNRKDSFVAEDID